MNDVSKLSGIITSLEGQARKVSEFSGVLSAVNDARKEIEYSKGLMAAALAESRHFLNDSRSKFDGLERRLLALEKRIEQIEAAQNRASDRLMSLDILTPQVFSDATKASDAIFLEHLLRLEGKVDALQTAQAQQHRNLLLLLATVVAIGALAVGLLRVS